MECSMTSSLSQTTRPPKGTITGFGEKAASPRSEASSTMETCRLCGSEGRLHPLKPKHRAAQKNLTFIWNKRRTRLLKKWNPTAGKRYTLCAKGIKRRGTRFFQLFPGKFDHFFESCYIPGTRWKEDPLMNPKETIPKPALVDIIKAEIASSGPMSFARFMAQALYHPLYGYYNASGEQIGWKGDFYTSSTVHPVFGTLIAKQLAQMCRLIKTPPFTVVEVGAGSGQLCLDILRALKTHDPEVYAQTRFVIVEKSPALKKLQQTKLVSRFPDQVFWEGKVPSELSGVVLSNELLDAFPVHRLKASKEELEEIYVDWQKGRFVEILGPPSSPRLTDYWARLKHSFQGPAAIEINLCALDWIKGIGSALEKGFLLTIDYGYPAAELYGPHRPKGSFLCYRSHQVNENPYVCIGAQDMTAHVDFTSFAAQGEQVGLRLTGFTDQMHFLMGLGIAKHMEALSARMDHSEAARSEFLAMKQLMDPSGMGRTFKVLIQEKGLCSNSELEGLRFKPFLRLDSV